MTGFPPSVNKWDILVRGTNNPKKVTQRWVAKGANDLQKEPILPANDISPSTSEVLEGAIGEGVGAGPSHEGL